MYDSMSTAGAAKADFGKRAIAYIIDAVLVAIVNQILSAILGGTLGSVLGIIVSLAYFGYFWTSDRWPGQTLGDVAMKIQVVRKDGKPIDYTTALLRWVGYIISAIPIGLGFWWVLWDPEKQGWMDKIAGTYVIQKT
jgi:uncharacterized RDD family membrane protein YckC